MITNFHENKSLRKSGHFFMAFFLHFDKKCVVTISAKFNPHGKESLKSTLFYSKDFSAEFRKWPKMETIRKFMSTNFIVLQFCPISRFMDHFEPTCSYKVGNQKKCRSDQIETFHGI